MSTLIHAAQSYLNYRGDITAGLEIGQVKGPTTYRAPMYVVDWEYDAGADLTRVGMSAVNPVSA
jgi:hypothetical protein